MIKSIILKIYQYPMKGNYLTNQIKIQNSQFTIEYLKN